MGRPTILDDQNSENRLFVEKHIFSDCTYPLFKNICVIKVFFIKLARLFLVALKMMFQLSFSANARDCLHSSQVATSFNIFKCLFRLLPGGDNSFNIFKYLFRIS